MNDKTGDIATENFFGLKSKMYSFLVDENREHKKTKDMNRNVVLINIKMCCWMINVWGIQWIEFKVKIAK